jgi:chemotaxis protein histidine kinase CheA
MADTTTATTPKKRAPAKRKPAAKPRRAAARATATRTTSTRPATRAERAQQLAERAVLIPVGVALEARDRVADTVGELVTTTRSRSALEKRLEHFERRGGSARTQLEREVRRTRTRLERQTRTARRGFDRQRTQVSKNLDLNVEALTTRVEKVVQNGVDAGMKLVNGAQDRLPKVV